MANTKNYVFCFFWGENGYNLKQAVLRYIWMNAEQYLLKNETWWNERLKIIFVFEGINSPIEPFVFELEKNETGVSGTILKNTCAEGKIPIR